MILLTSDRPLNRAENINAVYSAINEPKEFIQTDPWRYNPAVASRMYSVRVTDEFIKASPGKAVMIGHGICGGKTYGLDQPFPYHRKEFANLLTYVISTSEQTREIVAKQSGVSIDRVLPLGMPRTDAYFRENKTKTVLAGKRAYLYAPTWRNQKEPEFFEMDFDLIDQSLSDDEVFAVKPHMINGRMVKGSYSHVIEIPSGEPSTPYLMDCDVLITDYSSILFDAHVLGKPVILFEKTKGYVQSRGMYLQYPDDYSSRYCTDEESLIHMMKSADKPREADIKCKEFTAGSCDGHSTERVIQLIKELA